MVNISWNIVMTKKITVTVEESPIEELAKIAVDSGKKKAQIIREALQDYFDFQNCSS
jgi:predicted DNA-binding protein